MTLLTCHLCQISHSIVNDLIAHYKLVHNKCICFECSFCTRKYTHIESFRYHLKKHISNERITLSSDSVEYQSPRLETECLDIQSGHLIAQSEIIETQLLDNLTNSEINSFFNVDEIRLQFLKVFLQIYSDEKIPRSSALANSQKIISFYKKYISEIYSQLINLNCIDIDRKNYLALSLRNLITASEVHSEHKIISELKTSNYFFSIAYHSIHDELNECIGTDNSIVLNEINYIVALFPLMKFFTVLFNSTNFIREIILYYRSLLSPTNNGSIKNYIQSSHWKKIRSKYPMSENIFYLPMYIFSDDFEPNNALGSHSGIHKICGVYVKFACLPDHMTSKLCNLFAGMLLFSEDRKQFGNRRVFTQFISSLNKLESDGIILETAIEGYKEVKILPVLILGDNLGLNTILGFSESFSSNSFCRFCKMKRAETQKSCEEDISSLRSKINYDEDIKICNAKLTGIKESSVWNSLTNFHVTENLAVDVMHDLLEGVCHYDLIFILNSFITKYNFFTLEQLNYRILIFNYGPHCKNKPPILNSDSFSKQKLKLSAAEMKSLSMNLSLIIGDIVSECEEWTLYLLLREILSLCCHSDILQSNSNVLLNNLINEHHYLYLNLTKTALKPKYHNMTHYGRIMNEIGPLKHISSMRFEAFHQPFKKCATSCNTRVNLIKTILTKYQLSIANLLVNYEELNGNNVEKGKLINCNEKNIGQKFGLSVKFSLTSHIKVNNILYKKHMVVQVGNYEDELPKFAIILHVCYEPEYMLCLQSIKTHGFESHFYAYRVELEDIFFVVSIKSLITAKTSYLCKTNENKTFINWL